MSAKFKNEAKEFLLLLRSVPAAPVALFVLCVFVMNLLANKSIDLGVDWLALDCGIVVSWFAFLMMDVVTKHFGPKAATELSLFAIVINSAFCLILFACSKIPGTWSESFVPGSEGAINGALDRTIGGTWYVFMGSTVAFIASAIINNFANWGVGKLFKKKPDGAFAFIMRSYVSTALAQFADNLIFALIVGHFFFEWSIVQCLTCAATGMAAELIFEIAFSYLGFYITKRWKRDGVGREYFEFVKNTKEGNA